MGKIPYIDYNKLTGSYTVQRVAGMLELTTQELFAKVRQYNIRFYQDNFGRDMLNSAAIKKLHYRLYHESRGRRYV